jgi:hypothetical protein
LINPPVRSASAADAEDTPTRESHQIVIVDPGACTEVVSGPRAIASVHRVGEIIESPTPWASANPREEPGGA